MNDLINRQAAIDALCDNCDHVQAVCAHYPCKQYIAIEKLPSVQPEQKHGKWEVKHIGDFRFIVYCSACGAWRTPGVMKYCPNCGARMEE